MKLFAILWSVCLTFCCLTGVIGVTTPESAARDYDSGCTPIPLKDLATIVTDSMLPSDRIYTMMCCSKPVSQKCFNCMTASKDWPATEMTAGPGVGPRKLFAQTCINRGLTPYDTSTKTYLQNMAWGYNTVTDSTQKTHRIFKLCNKGKNTQGEWQVEGLTLLKLRETKFSAEDESYESTRSFVATRSMSLGLTGNLGKYASASAYMPGMFSGSAGYSATETRTKSTKGSKMSTTMRVNRLNYAWGFANTDAIPLDKEFSNRVASLPEVAYDYSKYKDFINKYGTHWVTDANFGAESTISAENSLETCTAGAESSIFLDLAMSKTLGMGAGASDVLKKKTEKTKKKKKNKKNTVAVSTSMSKSNKAAVAEVESKSSFTMHCRGGDCSKLNLGPVAGGMSGKPTATAAMFKSWETSITDNNIVMLEKKLKPISTLLCGTRKEFMQKALCTYMAMASNGIKPLADRPMCPISDATTNRATNVFLLVLALLVSMVYSECIGTGVIW